MLGCSGKSCKNPVQAKIVVRGGMDRDAGGTSGEPSWRTTEVRHPDGEGQKSIHVGEAFLADFTGRHALELISKCLIKIAFPDNKIHPYLYTLAKIFHNTIKKNRHHL